MDQMDTVPPRIGTHSPYRSMVTTANPHTRRVLGAHSVSTAADLLAARLHFTPTDARSRLQLVADNIGISGFELAELILYRTSSPADIAMPDVAVISR